MKDFVLCESEYRFMELIWEETPINSTELTKKAKQSLGWKKSTCYTVLKKLEDKGFVKNEKAQVSVLVQKEQVQRAQSDQLIEKRFGGSLPAFLNAFLKDRKLTAGEARELHQLIEQAVPEEDSFEGIAKESDLKKEDSEKGRKV